MGSFGFSFDFLGIPMWVNIPIPQAVGIAILVAVIVKAIITYKNK